MPGSLDLHGMFAALEVAVLPAPADPLDALAASEAIARDRVRIFDPECRDDAAPQRAAPRARRPAS